MRTAASLDSPSLQADLRGSMKLIAIALAKEIALALASQVRVERFYWQATSPLSRRTFLAEAKRGSFPAFKVGKRTYARREDVDAFVESRPLRGRELDRVTLLDMGAAPALERAGLRRAAP